MRPMRWDSAPEMTETEMGNLFIDAGVVAIFTSR
jgi:hypothetical protein